MKKYFTIKKTFLIIAIIFLAIQFIRPEKNTGEAYGNNDISHSLELSEDVKGILVASCYDCHSNFTEHMWYENIQPVGWWIANHIKEGKEELNFSEFHSYKNKRKAHKMEEIVEMVEEEEMPLSSYTLVHGGAKLSQEQKEKLILWAKASQKTFEVSK
jgi:hypothetical protein